MKSFNSQIVTLRSLSVSMASVQLATAATGTLVALYFAETGASQEAAALAPAFYSLGFLLGCFYISDWLANIGHVRSFAAGGAICTASTLLFAMSEFVPGLLFVRFTTGIATAGLYAIGDAWISESVDKDNRGRILAIYSIILGVMSVGSQVLIQFLPDDLNDSFILVSILYCLAIVVLTAARTDPPAIGSHAAVRLRALFRDAPTAWIGSFTIGMVTTSLLNVMPYRAATVGLDAKDIALGIGALYLGRILFMYPLGNASDKGDRRLVILVSASAASFLLLLTAIWGNGDGTAYMAAAGISRLMMLGTIVLLGGTLLTMYSLLLAHAMDRTVPVYVASSSVTMLFVTTLGGIVGPLLASGVSAAFGDAAMTWLLLAMMAGFSVFAGARMIRTDAVSAAEKSHHVVTSATSVESVPSSKR